MEFIEDFIYGFIMEFKRNSKKNPFKVSRVTNY
jgi:hypothetical protein